MLDGGRNRGLWTQQVLGMSHLAFLGISEHFLMRRMADLHWRLIADAMGQRDVVFTDADGGHVHPATCAFSLRVLHPHAPKAGDVLEITSHLRRASRTRLLSIHDMMLNGAPFARFMMTTAFVTMDGGRGTPARSMDLLNLDGEDDGFAARAWSAARVDPMLSGASMTMPVCPMTEFSALGALYCASFVTLADRAEYELSGGQPRPVRAREVIFRGNIRPGDVVQVFVSADGAELTTRDGRPLCSIRTTRALAP